MFWTNEYTGNMGLGVYHSGLKYTAESMPMADIRFRFPEFLTLHPVPRVNWVNSLDSNKPYILVIRTSEHVMWKKSLKNLEESSEAIGTICCPETATTFPELLPVSCAAAIFPVG